MNILKYIITDDDLPVIFSSKIQHDTVLQTGISAGFLIASYDIRRNRFSAKCFGESSSLRLRSTSSDVLVIENYLNNNFISDAEVRE